MSSEVLNAFFGAFLIVLISFFVLEAFVFDIIHKQNEL